jgi:Ca-activated chloride channel homolog
MMGWRLQNPVWLLLAVVVLAVVWWSRARAAAERRVVQQRGIAARAARHAGDAVKRLLPWLRAAGLVLVVVALARPQRGLQEFRIRTEGIAIQMCMDRSGSMQALDFALDGERVNRLAAVKRVFHDFVAGQGTLPGRPDDLIGLIAFGGFAEAKAPLTLDHGALLQVLDTVNIPRPVTDSRGRVVNQQLLRRKWPPPSATRC